jgi:ubiquinone/menaquinone biosynthesis C-methylase UbiE
LGIFPEHDRRLKAQLVKRLSLKPNMRVLDLGCGRGAALSQLIEAVTDTGSKVVLVFRPVCSLVKMDQGFILGC